MVFNSTIKKTSAALKKKIILFINQNIQKKKTIIGKKNTLKNLTNKKITVVIVCNNMPTYLKIQLRLYSKIFSFKLIEFEGNNIEFAIACNLNFKVSIVTIVE